MMAARALSRSAPASWSCANAGTAATMQDRTKPIDGKSRFMRRLILAATALLLQTSAIDVLAQERPYFVTYDHHVEERGDLDVSVAATSGLPKDGERRYHSPWIEVEY